MQNFKYSWPFCFRHITQNDDDEHVFLVSCFVPSFAVFKTRRKKKRNIESNLCNISFRSSIFRYVYFEALIVQDECASVKSQSIQIEKCFVHRIQNMIMTFVKWCTSREYANEMKFYSQREFEYENRWPKKGTCTIHIHSLTLILRQIVCENPAKNDGEKTK